MSVSTRILQQGLRSPKKTAILFWENKQFTELCSYQGLAAKVSALKQRWKPGMKPGARIVLLAGNDPRIFPHLLAAWDLGVVVSLLDASLPTADLASLGLSEETQQLFLADNARRVFKLDALSSVCTSGAPV